MRKTAKGLRVVGYLEGLSYIALLGIAMPLKYVWEFPEAVRYLGAIHGALFILYVIAAIRTAWSARWPAIDLVEALAVSVFPLGPFLLEPGIGSDEGAVPAAVEPTSPITPDHS